MSLINEALKRARTEADRQAQAEREGTAPAAAWTPPPFSRRERSPVAASIVASLLVSLLVGATFYFLRGRNAPPAQPAPAAASAAQTAVPVAAPSPPAPVAAPAAASAQPAASTASSAVPAVAPERSTAPSRTAGPGPAGGTSAAVTRRTTLAAGSAAPAQDRRASEPEAAPPTDAESVAATGVVMPAHGVRAAPEPKPATASLAPASRPRHGQLDGRTFSAAVALPDGSRIDLGGIISGAIPLAMLNGRMIGIGEYAGAYAVVKIETRRVELRGPEGSFWLGLP